MACCRNRRRSLARGLMWPARCRPVTPPRRPARTSSTACGAHNTFGLVVGCSGQTQRPLGNGRALFVFAIGTQLSLAKIGIRMTHLEKTDLMSSSFGRASTFVSRILVAACPFATTWLWFALAAFATGLPAVYFRGDA